MRNVFFYDGNCPFCSSLADKLKQLCLKPEIEFLSFRKLSLLELSNIHKDLCTELLEGNVQFIYKNVRYPGFFAVRKLSHFLKGYRYLSIFLYIPLVPFIGIFVMEIIKRKKFFTQ